MQAVRFQITSNATKQDLKSEFRIGCFKKII